MFALFLLSILVIYISKLSSRFIFTVITEEGTLNKEIATLEQLYASYKVASLASDKSSLFAFDYDIIEELAEELLVNDKIEFSEEKLVCNKINKIAKENDKIELSEEKPIYGKIIEEKLVLEIELAEKTLNNIYDEIDQMLKYISKR